MSVNRSKPNTSTKSNQTSKPISLQDVEGMTIVGNEGAVTITDGGAIEGGLSLAGLTVEKAAELTLGLVARQADANAAALEFARQSATQGYSFAMDAGRSDVKIAQDAGKMLVIVAAIVAGAYVLSKWGKK